MTIHWKDVEQNFTVVRFVFQYYPVCNFGKFVTFDLEPSGVKGLTPKGSSTDKKNHLVLVIVEPFKFITG